MNAKLLSTDEFRAAARDNPMPEGTVVRFAPASPEVLAASRTIRFVFSDDSVDRAGDRIEVTGWDTSAFQKNNVALWAHDSRQLPIGRAKNVHVSGNRLLGDIEFAPPEVNPFADDVYRSVKAGFLNAVSVGFIPREWVFTSDKDRPFGIDFKRQELMEISVCPVPCNANALAEARAKGIDTAFIQNWWAKVLAEASPQASPSPSTGEGVAGTASAVQKATEGGGDTTAKSGRRISAANQALLQTALDHHESAMKCIKDVMTSDDPAADSAVDPNDPNKRLSALRRRALKLGVAA